MAGLYLFDGFLTRVDLLTCGGVSVIVTGLGDGQLASGSGSWTGLLGGVTNDGESGDSGVSLVYLTPSWDRVNWLRIWINCCVWGWTW